MDVRIQKRNGTLKVVADGHAIDPLSFKSFRPTERNISDFSRAGVRLLCIFPSDINSYLGVPYSLFGPSWVGENQIDFAPIDRQIDLFMRAAPDGLFALMIQVDTRDWWLKQHPDCANSFFCLSQAAAYEPWRRDAAAYLQAVLRHTEEHYGGRFYGYFLMGGQTTEWFSGSDYAASHPVKEAAWRRYTGDPQAVIPDEATRDATHHGVFRDPVKDAKALRYWRFHHELVADTLLWFAAKAQEVLAHKKPLGVYFGYLLELSGERLLNVGHLEYEKVFFSPDIDMIASPSAYGHRKHTDASAYMVTLDSLSLHDKLYYLEFDHITHLSPTHVGTMMIPGGHAKFQSEQETIDVMRRDFMLCLTKGAALWWFDMFEGWFYSQGMMDEIAAMVAIARNVAACPLRSVSEVAVFSGGESIYYLDKRADIHSDLLDRQRDGLARMGAPYDWYTMGDLDHPDLPHSQYKLYIFLDAFCLSESEKAAIERHVRQAGKAVLWAYAPDYVQADGFSLAAMAETVGMGLEKLEESEQTIATPWGDYGFRKKFQPLFAVADGQATALGTYAASGRPGLAFKKQGQGLSIYSGMGPLPGPVLRELARLAGVHLYNEGSDPVFATSGLIGVYADRDGDLSLRLPAGSPETWCDLFSGACVQAKNGFLSMTLRRGEARLYSCPGRSVSPCPKTH